MKYMTPLIALLLLGMAAPAQSLSLPLNPVQDPSTLRVCTALFTPFVFEESGEDLHGYDIDMMRELAQELQVSVEFVPVQMERRFGMLQSGACDALVGGVSITSSREEKMDFSGSYFNSGLQMSVKAPDRSQVRILIGNIFSWEAFQLWGAFLGMLMIFGVCLYLADLGTNKVDEGGIDDRPWPGLGEGSWVAFMIASTIGFGGIRPITWIARALTIPIFILSVSFFGAFIGQMEALATRDLQVTMDTDALRGASVAVRVDTTSEDAVRKLGAKVVPVHSDAEAYTLLKEDKVLAFVSDSPALRYYSAHEGAGDVLVTGALFERQNYGVVLPSGSARRERINRGLLRMQERGVFEHLDRQYFGE